MKITVLSVGKVRQRFVLEGESEYLGRLGHGFQVELRELGIDIPESLSPEEAKEREGKVLLEKLTGFDYVVALDQLGKQLTSEEFSELLRGRRDAGKRSMCFVIGGAYGLSEKVRQRSNSILSLSKCTFPHQLTRLILVEQLYRSYTLMQGIRYHK